MQKKLELIMVVIQGIKFFWLQILPIPLGIMDKIYTLCRKFLWTGNHPLIVRSTFCVSKENNGIGLWDLRLWNNYQEKIDFLLCH